MEKLEKREKAFDPKFEKLDEALRELQENRKTERVLEKPFNRNINNIDISGDGDCCSCSLTVTPRNSRVMPISNEMRVVLGYNSRLLNIYVSET